MSKEKHPRFSRLRTRPKRIRKSRRLKNKKPPQTPTLFPPIVNYKNSCDNLFNISNKYLRKNTNNSKTLESLVNDLRPEFSFGSVINSLSSSRFISYTQPNTYSGKKSEDDSLYRHILELPSPDGLRGNDDLDQAKELELSHYTNSPKHEIFNITKPHRKVTPYCHKPSSREFLRRSV